MDSCTQPARRKTKDSTPRAHIQKCLTVENLNREHLPERVLSFGNPRIVERAQEAAPILSELKPLPTSNLSGMRACYLAFLDVQSRFHAVASLRFFSSGREWSRFPEALNRR